MTRDSLYIVVVGCGRLGAYLANQLSQEGHSVVAVDIDGEAFKRLAAAYSGFRLEGDGTELAVLRQAKADKANLVLATTRRDNVNLMVAQLAKSAMGVPRVIARVFDPEREESYRLLGVETVCPTLIAGRVFLGTLSESES